MALDNLTNTITGLRERAAEVMAGHRSRVNEIRADASLSISGKAAKLADNYLTARTALGNLHQQEVTALKTVRNDLERALFGQFSNDPSAIIAYRDAQDRASRLQYNQQEEATALLRTALLSDDTTLIAAIVSRAMSAGWEQIIGVFSDARPNEAARINDLADIINFQDNPDAEFKRGLAYEITAPSEIGRQSDRALTEMATGTQVRNDMTADGMPWW